MKIHISHHHAIEHPIVGAEVLLHVDWIFKVSVRELRDLSPAIARHKVVELLILLIDVPHLRKLLW
jgi:hypothetical protein